MGYRRLYFIVILSMGMTTLTGCWNLKELNTISIVSSVALDKAEEGVRATFEIYKPHNISSGSEDGKGNLKSIKTFSEGQLNFEAIRNAPKHVNRRLFLPHAKVLLISEDLFQENIMDYLDFWIRDSEIRENIDLLIVKGSKAYEVLNVNTGLETISSQYVESLLEGLQSNSESKRVTLLDFMADYYDESIENVLPYIEIIPDEENKDVLLLNGIGVIRDGCLEGYLDGIETRAYNFVTGNIKSAILVAKTPSLNATSGIEILSSKTKIKYIKEQMEFDIKVNIKGMLSEQKNAVDLKNSENINQIEESCANTVKSQIEDVIKKAQKTFKTDIFGFGQIIHRQSPKEWKELKYKWKEYYPDAKVNVSVDVKIQRRGMSNSSAKWKDDK